MSETLTATLEDLRLVAEQRGWEDVRGVASHLLTAESVPTLLLAAPAAYDSGPFKRWLSEAVRFRDIETATLERLNPDAPAFLMADRLVLLVPCVRLLDADVLEAVHRLAGERPASDCVVVLAGVEAVSDDEDLAVVERGANRLLSPEYSGDAVTTGSPKRVFLWDAGSPREFLAAQLKEDRQGLAGWLGRPFARTVRATSGRVLSLLALAEERMLADDSAGTEGQTSQRLLSARESILELRRRLLHWLDAQGSSLEKELTTSLRTLEQDLLYGLRTRLGGATAKAPVPRLLQEYLERGVTRWRQEAAARWRARAAEIAADGESLLRGADWGLINETASRYGHGPYPQAFEGELRNLTWAGEEGLEESAGRFTEAGREGFDLKEALYPTVAGSLGAAAVKLMGLSVLGMVLGGAVGVIGGALVSHRVRREHDLRAAEDYARSVIVEVVRQLVDQVRERSRQTVHALRERLGIALRTLEAVLDQAIDDARHAAQAASVPDDDRRVLDACRVRIAADPEIRPGG